jgi:hypothetical protein
MGYEIETALFHLSIGQPPMPKILEEQVIAGNQPRAVLHMQSRRQAYDDCYPLRQTGRYAEQISLYVDVRCASGAWRHC